MTNDRERTCPLCAKRTALDHEFCDQCGRRIADYCVECGAERRGAGAFCVKCGREFKPFAAPAPRTAEAPPMDETAPGSVGPAAAFIPRWFKRLILGGVVVVVVAAAGIWLTVWFQRQWRDLAEEPGAASVDSTVENAGGIPTASSAVLTVPDTIPLFSKEARWQARFEEGYMEAWSRFRPVEVGGIVELETRTGLRMTGTVVAISNRWVTINREGVEVGVEAAQLTAETAGRLFREEYARQEAARRVEQEQRNEGYRRLRSVAETRSATRPATTRPGPPAVAAPAAPQTEFQTDLQVFKSFMVRLVISLLVIAGVGVVIRHLW